MNDLRSKRCQLTLVAEPKGRTVKLWSVAKHTTGVLGGILTGDLNPQSRNQFFLSLWRLQKE